VVLWARKNRVKESSEPRPTKQANRVSFLSKQVQGNEIGNLISILVAMYYPGVWLQSRMLTKKRNQETN